MSTLTSKDFSIMEEQIKNAKGKTVPKDAVLFIIQEKLKEADKKNPFIVDRIDGVALKEILEFVSEINT